jgi:hypothetical protein
MTAEQIYTLANQLAIACWVVLAISLFWNRLRHVAQWLAKFGMPVLLGLVYLGAVLLKDPQAGGDFSSIAGVRQLFESDTLLLAGWVHYLVFDFFVGAWIARDSLDRGIHGLLVLPCLFLCLMAGPLGLLLYLSIRGGHRLLPRAA